MCCSHASCVMMCEPCGDIYQGRRLLCCHCVLCASYKSHSGVHWGLCLNIKPKDLQRQSLLKQLNIHKYSCVCSCHIKPGFTLIWLDEQSCIRVAVRGDCRGPGLGAKSSVYDLTGNIQTPVIAACSSSLPSECSRMKPELVNLINTDAGLLDIIGAGQRLPADLQRYLEFGPVLHLWFWKLVLSWA